MRTQRKSTLLLLATLLASLPGGQLGAQYIDDAIRLGTTGPGVGARALALGGAYTAVANDFTAMYWNPAGLAQLRLSEFSIGFSYMNQKDEASFGTTVTPYSVGSTALNNVGFAIPAEVRRGSLVFAVGYMRNTDFASGLSFRGFNPASSYVQYWAPDGTRYDPTGLRDNLAYQTYLADIDTVRGTWISPIRNRVTQAGRVLEDGGLNQWSIGGAIDVARNLSLGVTLSYLAGSYSYERSFTESDSAHVYQTYPFDYRALEVGEFVRGSIGGVQAKFGLMFRAPDVFRFGFAVQTPAAFSIDEEYGSSARATFDDLRMEPLEGPFRSDGRVNYEVITPWVFSGGLSLILGPLMLTGDAEATDWSTLEFAGNSELTALNPDIRDSLGLALGARVGAELDIPFLPVRARAGAAYLQSPYRNDPASFDRKRLSAGLGIQLAETVMLDAAYCYGWWDTYRLNYDATSRVDEKITSQTAVLTLSVRF